MTEGDSREVEGEPEVIEPRKRFSVRDFLENRLFGVLPKLRFQPGISLKYMMVF